MVDKYWCQKWCTKISLLYIPLRHGVISGIHSLNWREINFNEKLEKHSVRLGATISPSETWKKKLTSFLGPYVCQIEGYFIPVKMHDSWWFMLKRTPRKTPISLTPKHPKLRLSLCCLDNKFFASLRIRCHRIPEPFLASSFIGKRGVDVMEKGAWLVEKHPLGGARTLEEFERCHWTRRSWWKMMVVFVYSIHKMIFRFLGHAAWINDSRYDDRT